MQSKLKNYKKDEESYNGQASWMLLGPHGPVDAFKTFCEEMIDDGVRYNTRRAYSTAAAFFLDYCYEAGVYGGHATRSDIRRAVKNYRFFLAQGAYSTKKEVSRLAQSLPHSVPAANQSICVALAGVNKFLDLSDELAQEQQELLRQSHGIEVDLASTQIFAVVRKLQNVSERERVKIRDTLVGGVVRNVADRFTKRPASLATKMNPGNTPEDVRWEFPLSSLGLLIDEAKLSRDKALYSLLAGGGIRISEALNLRWEHIDIRNRKVFVKDPHYERNLNTSADRIRFKGRKVSRVILYQPFKDMFFHHLRSYVDSSEYTVTSEHNYVFQVTQGKSKGAPLLEGDESSYWKIFTNTVRRLNIPQRPDGKLWSPHNLRHSYGVWMLNYIPTGNGYGYPLGVVSKMMGHSDPKVTARYARADVDDIDGQMEYYDKLVLSGSYSAHEFRKVRAERMLKEVKELLGEQGSIDLLQAPND